MQHCISRPVPVTVTKVVRAPFMAVVMRMSGGLGSQNSCRGVGRRGRTICKVTVGCGEEFGAFKKILPSRISPIGMQVHVRTFHTGAPHGNTAFPVFGHRPTLRVMAECVFPHKCKLQWTVRSSVFFFCRILLWYTERCR